MTQLLLLLLLAQAPAAPAPTGPAGRWQAMAGPGMTWVVELQIDGNKVTGTVSQTGDKAESAPIYFGSLEGNQLTFKVNSPDGDRIITFAGKVTSASIGFTRLVEVRPGGSRGDTGILGANGLSSLIMNRPAAGGGGPGGGRGAGGARGGAGAGGRGQQ
jgi:hypothetical protein